MDNKPVFDMVLFGGTGDLVMRKLLPSLYQAHAAGLLNQNGRLWALGRKDLGRDASSSQSRKVMRMRSEEVDGQPLRRSVANIGPPRQAGKP